MNADSRLPGHDECVRAVSNRQAGLVGSSNVYGAAIGALIAVFIVKRIRWRTWAYGLLAALIALDLLSTRFGRAWPLHGSEIAWVYALANGLIGVTWSFGIPYLLGMCAQFDQTGQSAALGGFASKMGMASGPLVAAWVVGADDFSRVINVGAVALVLALVAAMIPAILLDRAPID